MFDAIIERAELANVSIEDQIKAEARARRIRLLFGKAPYQEPEQAALPQPEQIKPTGYKVTYTIPSWVAVPGTVAQITQEVCQKYGVTKAEITGPQRAKRIVVPRFEAMWRAKRETHNSLPQIGRYMGNKDHTCILNACREYERYRRVKAGLEAPKPSDKPIDFNKIIGDE